MSGAEVLGVLGAVAAASQVAEQCLKIIGFISGIYKAVRDAPESIQKQVVQAEQLLGIATLIEYNVSLQTNPVTSILRSCQQEAEKLLDTLSKISIAASDGKATKLWKALDGTTKEKKILKHLETLEQQKSSLALCIATIDSKLLRTVHLDLVNVITGINKVSYELPGIRDTTRNVTTIIGTLPEIVGGIDDVNKALPNIARNVVTVHEDLAGVTVKVTAMHDMLPSIQEAVQQLSMRIPKSTETQPLKLHDRSFFRVPNRRARGFIGRDDILNEVNEGLTSGPAPRTVVLRGMGGQGKTQVALEYCHRARNNHFSTIFWIDATSENSVKKSFEVISEDIRPGTVILTSTNSMVDAVMTTLTAWPMPWLLVFDNYDDPKAFDNLPDYLPASEHGSILITTRHADVDALAQDGKAIELPGLQEKDALYLLLGQKKELETDISDAKRIVERLGYHPLAITQAGAYIVKRKIALKDFMDHYNRRRKLILEQTPQMSQYRRKLTNTDKETSLSVFTTWELSYQQLNSMQNEDNTKAELLTLFAFFNCKDISERLFKEYCINNSSFKQLPDCFSSLVDDLEFSLNSDHSWDSDHFIDILSELRDLSLLQGFAEEADGFRHFSLHPLVRDWIRLRTEKSLCQSYTILASEIMAAQIVPYWRNEQFEISLLAKREILSHLDTFEENYHDFLEKELLMSYEPSPLADFADRECWFGLLYFGTGRYKEAERMGRRVIKHREASLGSEHSETLRGICNLAFILERVGKFEEAEIVGRRVLDLSERLRGPEHPDTIMSIINLTVVLERLGKYEEAESWNRRVFELSQRVLGPEHPDTLRTIHNLALVLEKQGKFDEAEDLTRRVIELRGNVLGLEHPDTLMSMSNLALVLEKQGKYKEAEELNRRLLEINERVQGPEHPDTLRDMTNLSSVLSMQGECEEAEDMIRRVVDLNETVQGAEHPNTLTTLFRLASLLQLRQNYVSASQYYKRAINGFEKVLGPHHPTTLKCSATYALFLQHWPDTHE